MTLLATTLIIIFLAAVLFYIGLRKRFVNIWFWSHIKYSLRRKKNTTDGPVHLLFCFVDHYEPLVGKASDEVGKARVDHWVSEYPKVAHKYTDADGVHPQHSYFYPQEEYRQEHVNGIQALCEQGFGEIEVHIHHEDDSEAEFVTKMQQFAALLSDQHNSLPKLNGKPSFAFIHGNWALDNSRADGKWCGLNNEITLLKELGCYADFTLPSAPSDTQTSTINSIYYAMDDPATPKSHNTGIPLEAGAPNEGDLLIIQGPLTLNWKHRAFGIWPRIENGDVTPSDIPLEERIDLWIKQHIHVQGRPEWSFVKVHSHGANDENAEFLFEDGAFETMCQYLETKYNDGRNHVLHYVTARETYNIIKAAEAGHCGNPNKYRDFLLSPPGSIGDEPS